MLKKLSLFFGMLSVISISLFLISSTKGNKNIPIEYYTPIFEKYENANVTGLTACWDCAHGTLDMVCFCSTSEDETKCQVSINQTIPVGTKTIIYTFNCGYPATLFEDSVKGIVEIEYEAPTFFNKDILEDTEFYLNNDKIILSTIQNNQYREYNQNPPNETFTGVTRTRAFGNCWLLESSEGCQLLTCINSGTTSCNLLLTLSTVKEISFTFPCESLSQVLVCGSTVEIWY